MLSKSERLMYDKLERSKDYNEYVILLALNGEYVNPNDLLAATGAIFRRKR